MCMKQKKPAPMAPALPLPAPVADLPEVAEPRRAEDEQVYGEGGKPQTRVDRSATGGGVGASGTGLKPM